MNITVHQLDKNTRSAFCERQSKLGHPEDWPDGHKWVMAEEAEKVDCVHCKSERSRRARGK